MLIPTTCFNCESACGVLAYVEKKDLSVTKVTGNPAHPGSRGCDCAKGPATVNQMDDPSACCTRCTGPAGAATAHGSA